MMAFLSITNMCYSQIHFLPKTKVYCHSICNVYQNSNSNAAVPVPWQWSKRWTCDRSAVWSPFVKPRTADFDVKACVFYPPLTWRPLPAYINKMVYEVTVPGRFVYKLFFLLPGIYEMEQRNQDGSKMKKGNIVKNQVFEKIIDPVLFMKPIFHMRSSIF